MAEVAVPRQMFKEILRLIARLRAAPVAAWGALGSDATDNRDRSAPWSRQIGRQPTASACPRHRRGRSLLPWAA